MRQDPEFFGDQEMALIYVAKKLKEALRLEEQLTEAGFDYAVEPDKFLGGVVFRTERVGAFFYVTPAEEERARTMLTQAGYRPYVP